ncbi:amidohydrolase [Tindallia californiensis]|uniref:Amidohydrolase n=1 Tax=Tindallia californiensis TaxID=159292 RepID=A0A1H3R6J2_9FIRM|nr:amidohydrolase [Tindallia californiensis]SDZ20589.1 amidohydrolase [Tindallia californiensis]
MTVSIDAYAKKVYQQIHSTPEVGFEEHKTSRFIAEELKKMNYQVLENVGGTGVIGILDSGKAGPVFGLRADMDALAFEKNKIKYVFHACGHDAHSAIVLATAKKVSEQGIKQGKLYLVFQQAEEKLGANQMIDSGQLDELEELVGIHLRPIQECRLGQATPALYHGSSKRVDVQVKGLNAHGARPHLGINAVDASVMLTNAINCIKADPDVSHSIKVTRLNAGGDTFNTIPDKATLTMDIRAQTNEVMESILEKVKLAVEHSGKHLGGVGEITSINGSPAAEYDAHMVALAKNAIMEELGESLEAISTPGAEDFHFYTQRLGVKTAYIGLGADLSPGLHHPEMNFHQDALINGVNLLFNMTRKKLM